MKTSFLASWGELSLMASAISHWIYYPFITVKKPDLSGVLDDLKRLHDDLMEERGHLPRPTASVGSAAGGAQRAVEIAILDVETIARALREGILDMTLQGERWAASEFHTVMSEGTIEDGRALLRRLEGVLLGARGSEP